MKLTNEIIVREAKSVGFDLVGFAKADELKEEGNKLEEWLKLGYQSGMSYMERNTDKRKDVRKILPGAKSVISLALNYYTDENYSNDKNSGKVSRYAWGTDYHLIIWEKLEKLENTLKAIDPDFESMSYVDTGPVMDKVWAKKAGLGWIGKHTNLINKEIGSWFFLANIITNYDFNYLEEIPDFCGSCTACIEACPTNAIVQEYVVDANKCISNLTIENKNEIPQEFAGKFENWLFGCDICQDVCPWNIKFSEITGVPEFYPKDGNKEIELSEIKLMDNKQFKFRFARSPILRIKLRGLMRNADFIEQK
jgi:epoxyqueuosine reductase